MASTKMSEKLCLQWNDFKENISSAFGRLRDDKELTDVTLACEDGQHFEAHKVILAASSPFFEQILQKSKHPHPLIYLRGYQSKIFAYLLDFLYFGEAKICEKELDSFLAISEEIKLKVQTGQTMQDALGEQEQREYSETVIEGKEPFTTESNLDIGDLPPNPNTSAVPYKSPTILQELNEKVKTLMEMGSKVIPNGAEQRKSRICKVCGKEGVWNVIRDHIEAKHLEGISIPCEFCDKTCPSRVSLSMHKIKYHK